MGKFLSFYGREWNESKSVGWTSLVFQKVDMRTSEGLILLEKTL